MELCQRVLDGRGGPIDWKMKCGAYRGVKLLEHAMKIVKSVKNMTSGKSGQDAICIYAGKRSNRCCLYMEKDAGGIP